MLTFCNTTSKPLCYAKDFQVHCSTSLESIVRTFKIEGNIISESPYSHTNLTLQHAESEHTAAVCSQFL